MENISLIIPTLNEERGIVDALTQARELNPLEILVADGGSIDRTRSLAEPLADTFLLAPRGRSAQMNLAARQAKGDLLLFLHADCRLGKNALTRAKKVLNDKEVIAGCFHMKIRAPGFSYRLIERAAAARVEWAGLVYGDQGLFLRRSDFHRLGGFPNLLFMEDLFFSRSLAAKGKLRLAREDIFVSPRRWQKHGIVRQTLRNWTLTALALAGVHPDRLASFYPPPWDSP